MYTVTVNSFEEWRTQTRELLLRGVVPNDIQWQTDEQTTLFGEHNAFMVLPIQRQAINVPRAFVDLARNVSCHRDKQRWSLLYSVVWRLIFENPRLLSDVLDPQLVALLAMQKAISRDRHKMKAFVRFRKVANVAFTRDESTPHSVQADTERSTKSDNAEKDQHEYYVAWFEPQHCIVPITADFFVKRFANMHWSILTPDLCAHWHDKQLYYTAGVARPPHIEDELESLWLEYYKNIFNPARLKLKAMQAEMPKKYWVNLPEAAVITELTRESTAKAEAMIERGSSEDWRKTQKSRFVRQQQTRFRNKAQRAAKSYTNSIEYQALKEIILINNE